MSAMTTVGQAGVFDYIPAARCLLVLLQHRFFANFFRGINVILYKMTFANASLVKRH
jgi:hypothetical protein